MAGISPELSKLLRKTLLDCGPFTSNQELSAVFSDARVNIWAYSVPQAGTPVGRVDNVIAYLHDKYNIHQQNALVLLVEVLVDRSDVQDACNQQLRNLASALAVELNKGESQGGTASALPTSNFFPQKRSVPESTEFNNDIAVRVYEVLKDRFNLAELSELCFYLSVEVENLSEATRAGKARELVSHYQRRDQMPVLVQAVERFRPDISISDLSANNFG